MRLACGDRKLANLASWLYAIEQLSDLEGEEGVNILEELAGCCMKIEESRSSRLPSVDEAHYRYQSFSHRGKVWRYPAKQTPWWVSLVLAFLTTVSVKNDIDITFEIGQNLYTSNLTIPRMNYRASILPFSHDVIR